MQAIVDALRINPDLRAVVCNVEMPPEILLDRQLARLSGIDSTTIRYRQLTSQHAQRIDAGIATIRAFADRLTFVSRPFDLANIAAVLYESQANMVLLDYLQRVKPPGEHGDKRSSVDATMSYLRQFADADTAVIVLSAVGRSRDTGREILATRYGDSSKFSNNSLLLPQKNHQRFRCQRIFVPKSFRFPKLVENQTHSQKTNFS